MAKSVLESQNKKSTTLPADFHYDPNSLTRLFLKPDVKVCGLSGSHWCLAAGPRFSSRGI